MGFSILDAPPNNECLNIGAEEAWFSFIFCGSRIDKINLHAYDYYSGAEIVGTEDVAYQEVPALEKKLDIWNGAGNGLRINIRDFVKDASVFSDEGEYTWRAELIQDIDIDRKKYPDNMVYEGILPGDPDFYAVVDNLQGLDYDHELPLAPCYKGRIRPPYYVDFLDSKFESTAYDIPITFDRVQNKNDGTQDTVIQLDTYSSTVDGANVVVRPTIGSTVFIHKQKYFGAFTTMGTNAEDEIFIDSDIKSINANDYDNTVVEDCYLKVGKDYFRISSYNKKLGIVRCENGEKLKSLFSIF